MDLKLENRLEEWCCNKKVIIQWFNAEKRSISECLSSPLALLVCIILSCIKSFNGINF